jgi:RNA polymerase sigma-70 factor (ECF subfamily)
VRRAQVGDAEAFGALLSRHRTSALRVAAVVLGGAADADDVVQTASERAWRAFAGVDAERGFRAWYLRIVANTARNHRRGRWRRRRAELRVAARSSDRTADALDDTVTAAERALVVAALNRLDAAERLVIALRHFEQLTEREIADVLECPAGTVKSRLSRAMARLRTELSTEAFDGE